MQIRSISLIYSLACTAAYAQNPREAVAVSPSFVVEGQVVKGVPYTAHAVTTSKQTLVTGSEVSSSVTALVARDSEGRTRREQTLLGIGGWTIERSESPTVIVIQDPVKMVNYVLNPKTHLARMNRQLPPVNPEEARRREERRRAEVNQREPRSERTESLGTKVMEGVKTEGRRTITTFPIGSVRNSAPIEVIAETWYSPDLQEVVYTKRTDPRFGETTYRLTDIKRAEPPASLFEVPADYRVEAESERGLNERERRK
jgi:hypothetical protein